MGVTIDMKILIFLFVILINTIHSQEEYLGGTKEIYLRTYNVNPNDTINFSLDACGAVWAWDNIAPYDISISYNGSSILNSSIKIVGTYSGWEKGWETLITGGAHLPPYYSHGLYKFTVYKNNSSNKIIFYIDFRDSDWNGLTYPGGNDIYLNYDGIVNDISIKWGDGSSNETNIINHQLYRFWIEKGKIMYLQITFPISGRTL